MKRIIITKNKILLKSLNIPKEVFFTSIEITDKIDQKGLVVILCYGAEKRYLVINFVRKN